MNQIVFLFLFATIFVCLSNVAAVSRAQDDVIRQCVEKCADDQDTETLCNVNAKIKVQKYKNKCVAKCASPVPPKERKDWVDKAGSCTEERSFDRFENGLPRADETLIKKCEEEDCKEDAEEEICHYHYELDLQMYKNRCVANCAAPYWGARVRPWLGALVNCKDIKF